MIGATVLMYSIDSVVYRNEYVGHGESLIRAHVSLLSNE